MKQSVTFRILYIFLGLEYVYFCYYNKESKVAHCYLTVIEDESLRSTDPICLTTGESFLNCTQHSKEIAVCNKRSIVKSSLNLIRSCKLGPKKNVLTSFKSNALNGL